MVRGQGGDAQEPMTALATSVAGTTQPNIAPMSEIPANTTIRVGQGSRLTLIHYQNCTTETITGGTVTVLATGFDDSAASVEGRAATGCPTVEPLLIADRGTDTAVTVMRGQAPPGGSSFAAPSLTVPARSELYFAGRQAPNIVSVAVVDALGRAVVTDSSGARMLRLNLVPGQAYRLRLAVRGWAQSVERTVAVTPLTGTVVLRVE
jgi:hypothetical protein